MNYNPLQRKLQIGEPYFFADLNDGMIKAATWTEMPNQLRHAIFGNVFAKAEDAQSYLHDLDVHAPLDYANREEV